MGKQGLGFAGFYLCDWKQKIINCLVAIRFCGATAAEADHGKVQWYCSLLVPVGEGAHSPAAGQGTHFPALLLAHNILTPHAGKLAFHPVSCFYISFSQQSGMHFYERLFLCVLLRFRQLKFSFKP